MKVDMSAAAMTARLQLASDLSDLTRERRLDAKLDMSPSGITARLREASELLEVCRKLAQAGASNLTSRAQHALGEREREHEP